MRARGAPYKSFNPEPQGGPVLHSNSPTYATGGTVAENSGMGAGVWASLRGACVPMCSSRLCCISA